MKRKQALCAFVVLSLIASWSMVAPAQVLTTDQVPALVRQMFKTKFPAVKQVEWKLKADKNYEAEFTLKGTDIAAKFDAAGKWLETESAISPSKLPKPVRSAVDQQFKGYTVVETQSIRRWDEKPLLYELHLEKGKEVVKAQFSADGTILNRSAKPKPEKGP